MREKTKELINLRYITHYAYCDNCDVQLESTGMMYATYPPQYPYICPKCNKKYTFNRNYPYTEITGDEVNEQGFAISL